MPALTARRSRVGLVAAVVLAVFLWWVSGDADPTPRSDASGLPAVALADLPPEAGETLDMIDTGGPYPHDQEGGVFMTARRSSPTSPTGTTGSAP